jgi:hypothetical protein
VFGFGVLVTRVEEGFGRDAADVEASASEAPSAFDAGDLHAELACFDGSDVAAWTSTDDYKVL